MGQMNPSARGYHRLLKLARTIADLAGSESIQAAYLAEALHLRPGVWDIIEIQKKSRAGFYSARLLILGQLVQANLCLLQPEAGCSFADAQSIECSKRQIAIAKDSSAEQAIRPMAARSRSKSPFRGIFV